VVQATSSLTAGIAEDFGKALHAFRARLSAGAQEIGRGAVLHQLIGLGPSRPSELASCAHLDLSTVSRHLAALERDGLVAKLADPADGRAHLVTVTDSGKAHVADFLARRDATVAQATERWTESERTELGRLLRKLAEDLAAPSGAERGKP